MDEVSFDIQRFATIDNSTANTVVTGTAEDDSIKNIGSNVTIVSGAGDDNVYNNGITVYIDVGDGKNTVSNYSSQVTINGGTGNDSVYNYGSNSFIDVGDGNDTINNMWSSRVTIYSGADNDFIVNKGNDAVIYSGTGNDTIENNSRFSTIQAEAGDDFIKNYSDYTSIYGGASNDTIEGNGTEAIFFGTGDGKDVVTNYRNKNSINLTSGSLQKTLISGSDVILGFGTNDSLTLKNSANRYIVINNVDKTKTIINEERAGKYIYNSSADTVVSGGLGDDFVYNYYDRVSINAGEGDDCIDNRGIDVTINGGANNDSIENKGSNAVINGGSGDDSVYNYATKNFIDVGTGNNYIYDRGSDTTIIAGEGRDSIDNYGSNVFVIAGGGNTSVRGSNVTIRGSKNNDILSADEYYSQVFEYSKGGGNDLITNYSGEDTIHIADGQIDSYSFDGGDLIFHIGNGSLRLKNMTNHAITVTDSSGNTTTQIYSNGYSPQQVIKNLVQAWHKTMLTDRSVLKLDESIQLCSQFKSIQEVIDQMVADCRRVNNAETF